MINLLRFLYAKRNFLFFVLLEVLCGWLIFTFNKYQGSFYFNSANAVVGSTLKTSKNITAYFDLQKQNDLLSKENSMLRTLLEKEKRIHKIPPLSSADTLRQDAFDFIPARVVKNSVTDTRNFITIDKGAEDGLGPYMGLIGPKGVIGEIKYCSGHYATGFSLLHVNNGISSKLSRSGAIGTVQWDGIDARYAKLNYVGRHYFVQPGDTIVTSGFNAVFPAGIPVGVVEKVSDGNQAFYNITVKLATDFGALDHVYVIRNKKKPEIDSLELKLKR